MAGLHNTLIPVAALLAAMTPPVTAAPAAKEMIFVPAMGDDQPYESGSGTNCIVLHQIRSAHIVAGQGIVYRMSGRKTWINRPRHGMSHLDEDQVLITRTSGAVLCAGDIVTVADGWVGATTRSVALGRFEPYRPVASE